MCHPSESLYCSGGLSCSCSKGELLLTHCHACCSSCLWLVVTKSSEMNVQMCQSSVYYAPQIFSFNFYRQLLVSPSPTHSALAPLHFPDQNKVPVSAVDLLIDDNPKKKNQRNVKLCCQIFWLGSSSDKRQSEDFFLNIKSCPWAAHISSAEPRASVGRYKDLSYHRLQHHCTALHWLSIVTRVPQIWHRYCDTQYSEAYVHKQILSRTLTVGLITKPTISEGFAGETWRQLV